MKCFWFVHSNVLQPTTMRVAGASLEIDVNAARKQGYIINNTPKAVKSTRGLLLKQKKKRE
jgi:hypothetical protein